MSLENYRIFKLDYFDKLAAITQEPRSPAANMCCPLCSSTQIQPYHQDKKRAYLQCLNCQLVFVPKQFHLSACDEKAIYDLHQNQIDDPGYRKFISRTLSPLLTKVKAGAKGLDFGCGPGPALSAMAAEQGFDVANYDLFYFPDSQLLNCQYDFISMTEVIEHLASPMQVLKLLDAMLKPSAILAIMTKRVLNQEAFAHWHYTQDATHISFFSEYTFRWLAKQMNWTLEVIDKDVVFLTKA